MPPRFAYWTLLIDGAATAFRARDHEDLLPTLNQLRRRHKEVTLRYFARGKLWDSPEQAQWAAAQARPARASRGPDWRPGTAPKDARIASEKGRPKAPRRDRDDRANQPAHRGTARPADSKPLQQSGNRRFREAGTHHHGSGGPHARRPWVPHAKGHTDQPGSKAGRGPQRPDHKGRRPRPGQSGKSADSQRAWNTKAAGAGRSPGQRKDGVGASKEHETPHPRGARQDDRGRRSDFGKGRKAPASASPSVTTRPEDLDRVKRSGVQPTGATPKTSDSDR